MGSTAVAVFLFQEFNVFLGCQTLHEMIVGAFFAVGKITAADQYMIDLILSDERDFFTSTS